MKLFKSNMTTPNINKLNDYKYGTSELSNSNSNKNTRGHHGVSIVSVMLVIAFVVLGLLSLSQHYQIQQLKQQTILDTNLGAQQNRTLTSQLVLIRNQLQQSYPELLFNNTIGQQNNLSHDLIKDYSSGVCLIQGEYVFIDPESGKPLTQSEMYSKSRDLVQGTSFAYDQLTAQNNDLLPGQDDSPIVVHYTGTGFLIDSRGYIITNHHVTQPWQHAQEYQFILEAGYLPELILFRAFFPGYAKPYELTTVKLDETKDLALLFSPSVPAQIQPLPCAHENESIQAGETVIVLGYPTGFDLLLAKMEQADIEQLIHSPEGISYDELAEIMSTRSLIEPVATRGMCGRVAKAKFLYDAPTAIGGSGSPVIGPAGTVVGINTALLKGFSGTNFGVPISYAYDLLKNTVDSNQAYMIDMADSDIISNQ